MTFYITTLGCKVNQYESQYMREILLKNGYTEADKADIADINIINSCTVTAVADAKNRKTVNRLRRENPSTVIILTGCMPQTVSFDEDAIYDKCDIVLGNIERSKIADIISEYYSSYIKTVNVKEHKKDEMFESQIISSFEERTRAFVKIEDGCNQFCTYCTIPYARGRVRSKSLDDIYKEVSMLADNGYNEIVLVGINLSCYGIDTGHSLEDAVKTVCSVEKIRRVRLGSFEPENLTHEMMEILSHEEKFCPQFHLSLQSGCTDTLKRMHRKYTADDYMNILENIRMNFDNPGITTDVMVGFAGESEEEFRQSLEFVKKARFAKVHIFPYSRRKGTKAYNYPDQVDEKIKKSRCKEMEIIAKEGRKEFLNEQIGKIESVLFETSHSNNIYIGYTMNYTPVKVLSDIDLCGKIYTVKINGVINDQCTGEICI